jgi:hypothetical protein
MEVVSRAAFLAMEGLIASVGVLVVLRHPEAPLQVLEKLFLQQENSAVVIQLGAKVVM